MQVLEERSAPNYFSATYWHSNNFNELVNQYEGRLFNYIYGLVQDRQLAQDLVQDTFYNAYNNLSKNEHRAEERSNQAQANFSAWLFTIARNNALSALRRRKISPQIPAGALEASNPEISEGWDWYDNLSVTAPEQNHENNLAQREELVQAINRLGQSRVIPLLLFVEGFSYQEIAEMTGKTLGGVKGVIFRIKKDLRAILV